MQACKYNSWSWMAAVAAATLVLLSATTVPAKSPYFDWTYPPISVEPPAPERIELPNGMIVLFLPDSRLPVVSATAIVRAGEVYVPDDKAGLAGIVGEVLTTGGTLTRPPDALDETLEFLSIELGGDISNEAGNFSVRCLSKDVDTAMTIFAEVLKQPRFDSAKLQLAIDDAVENWRRRNDSPGRITSREFAHLIYGGHPYGRTPDRTTLESLTHDDVMSYYQRHFAPNNTILAVAGDLTRAKLDAILAAHFADWAKSTSMLPDPPAPPTQMATGIFQINKDINQANIRFGHLGIDRKNPDRHAIRVMNDILGGGGFTSRMMGRVRSDSGWAYSVGTAFTMPSQPGMFYAACQTKVESASKTIALMTWVIDDLLKNGVTDDELTTARESILNSEVFEYVTPSQIVNQYAWQEYFGFPPDQLKLDIEAVKTVSKDDVNAVARKYLQPGKYAVLAVGPIDKFDQPLTRFGEVKTLELDESE
ncbi:MAG: pitrilysin family protein [Candidatus Zixiibacteriota bacterium]